MNCLKQKDAMYYNLRMVYITTPDKPTAKNLGHKILQKRLAACANIVDGMESMYWWEGKITEDKECILLVKTHYSNMKQLTKLVEKYHPYDCPCIISYTITEDEGSEGYRNWLFKESLK